MKDNEEIRVTSETGGQKGSKLAQFAALDPFAITELAKVAGFGAEKYAQHNFLRGYAYSLSVNAAQRHLLAWLGGEDLDPESGLPHLAHAMWNLHTLIAFQKRGIGTDDRPTPKNVELDRLIAKAIELDWLPAERMERPLTEEESAEIDEIAAAVPIHFEGEQGERPEVSRLDAALWRQRQQGR